MTQRGFTLVEVMFAIAILALTLPILLGLRNRDLDLLNQASAITTATLLAQEKMFETELTGLPSVGEQSGEFTDRLPGFQFPTAPPDRAKDFRWKRIVASTPFDTIREVRVRVSWSSASPGILPGSGKEDAVEITHYVVLDASPAS